MLADFKKFSLSDSAINLQQDPSYIRYVFLTYSVVKVLVIITGLCFGMKTVSACIDWIIGITCC